VPCAWLHSQPTPTVATSARPLSATASSIGVTGPGRAGTWEEGSIRRRTSGSAAASAAPMSSAWARVSVPK
jgi:hypothetical protein